MFKQSLIFLYLLSGCTYAVTVESRPAGAMMKLPNGSLVSTPQQVKLSSLSTKKYLVEVTSKGYRPMTVDLRRRPASEWRWLGDRPRQLSSEIHKRMEIVLIPDHGPTGAGEITPDDLNAW